MTKNSDMAVKDSCTRVMAMILRKEISRKQSATIKPFWLQFQTDNEKQKNYTDFSKVKDIFTILNQFQSPGDD